VGLEEGDLVGEEMEGLGVKVVALAEGGAEGEDTEP